MWLRVFLSSFLATSLCHVPHSAHAGTCAEHSHTAFKMQRHSAKAIVPSGVDTKAHLALLVCGGVAVLCALRRGVAPAANTIRQPAHPCNNGIRLLQVDGVA